MFQNEDPPKVSQAALELQNAGPSMAVDVRHSPRLLESFWGYEFTSFLRLTLQRLISRVCLVQ